MHQGSKDHHVSLYMYGNQENKDSKDNLSN